MGEESRSELTLAGLRRQGGRRRGPTPATHPLQTALFGDHSAAAEPQVEAGQSIQGAQAAHAIEPPSRAKQPPAREGEFLPLSPSGALASPHPPLPVARERLLPEPAPPAPQRWTVSELVRHVRGVVERGYGQVTVEGEISNWRPAGSGHCYFTLKDAEAQLSAVIFRRQASLLRFRPADGAAVRVHGQLSVYESRGQMQVLVEWMEQVGFGAVLAALQQLKERLRREGLFDRKRPLPPFPRCIGVITSLRGAALRDIVKVCRRRHATVQLLIYPAAVQGPNCAAEIAAGLRWFHAHPDHAEVLLVARGGGSWEDLHGFDDEAVVRAIAACALPVITGLGHATDSTLADLAADLCAPTPSAAAELLTAAQHRVEERLGRLDSRLLHAISFQTLRTQQRLSRLGAAAVLRRVGDSLRRRAQVLDELGFRMAAANRSRLGSTQTALRTLQTRLQQASPTVRLADSQRRLQGLALRLRAAGAQRPAAGARRLDRAAHRLEVLSPLRVLDRGYALVYGPDGRLLRTADSAAPGQEITARLARGSVRARVTERRNG